MSVIESAAYRLEGHVLSGGWTVLARTSRASDHSGGECSVSYTVRHDNGTTGFLKAFDYASALADDDPARALERLTRIFNAERDLLAECGNRKLRRVVRIVRHGKVQAGPGLLDTVNYLIFEHADGGDARDIVATNDPAEQLPMLRLAHHAAVALSQLHSIGAAHQDVKPSNLLVWSSDAGHEGKLGDLGRAHMLGRPSPIDELLIPGDWTYAPPEQLYQCRERLADPLRRYAADLYMLGGLFCYLLTGVAYSGIFYSFVDETQHWRQAAGALDEVLPGLVDAHGNALGRIEDTIPQCVSGEVRGLLDDLCHPNSELRGDKVARRYGRNPYRLDRFISRLDAAHRRLAIASRSA